MQAATTSPPTTAHPREKWRTLLLIALAELLAMAVWFSASAVLPALREAWALDDSGASWLTMAVQIGFVAGAFGSSVLTLADRIPARQLFAGSSLAAAALTALIPLAAGSLPPADALPLALILRFLTGVTLAGVYPVGMKLMTTWTVQDRGLGIGLLVGALTVGSASPHLINVLGGVTDWQPVLLLAAGSAAAGGVIALLFVREGPHRSAAPRFEWRQIGRVLRDRGVMLANAGYLGHMWELYAMWAWIPAFLLASFQRAGVGTQWAGVVSFAVIAVGGPGSVIAGQLADRVGRTAVTSAAMALSGACALGIGLLFGGNPALVSAVALLWGLTVVADSAQFSACVSELADRELVGTALTFQTSLGFLLTLVSIRLVPTLQGAFGWEGAFTFLALGPAAGIAAMLLLRRLPLAAQLAGGRR